MFQISLPVIMVWLVSILVGSITVVIFLGSKKISTRAFAFCIFCDTAWVVMVGLIMSATRPELAIFFVRLAYYLGSLISAAFLYFFITFPEDREPPTWLTYSLIFLEIAFAYIFIRSDLVISHVYRNASISQWSWNYGSFSLLFEISFFLFFCIGIYILFKKYASSPIGNKRMNLRFMLVAIITGIVPPSLFSVILLRLNFFDLNWLGALSQFIWIPIIAYSILRYRQMDVRAVFTEVLAIAMAVIFFINIFVDFPLGIWDNVAEFLIFLILAIYLIRGVLREAKQREELNDLNRNLETKVAEKTVEVRRAYDAERHARLELEKLNDAKDQFILITQHNLRAPVSNLNNMLDMTLADEYGPLSPDLRAVLASCRKSGNRLATLIDEFLNITTMKAGASILDQHPASLKLVIEEILDDLAVPIEQMSIKVGYSRSEQDWPPVLVDLPKIRECLFVILDNAVRYNRRDGAVNIRTHLNTDAFILRIENTGIGISAQESEKIGSALFYRGEHARTAHPIGMGVGLSVVKAMIRAHKGSFTISSEGPGKGAAVTIELPLARN